MKKKAIRKHGGKGEIAQNEQFYLFPQCFLCNLYLKVSIAPDYKGVCLQNTSKPHSCHLKIWCLF